MKAVNPDTNERKDLFDRFMELPFFRLFGPIWRRHREVLLYLFFGGLTTVISIAGFAFCVYAAGIDALISNVISWILAVLFAYITNSIWVFRAKPRNIRERFSQMAGFYGGRVATLVMEEAVLLIGIRFLGFPDLPVKIAAQVLVLVGNYLISKLLVFK